MLSQDKPIEVKGIERERVVVAKKKKSGEYKTKPISFKREYWDVYDYLMKQGNASRYVIDLIRADMKKAEHGQEVRAKASNGIDEDLVDGAMDLLG